MGINSKPASVLEKVDLLPRRLYLIKEEEIEINNVKTPQSMIAITIILKVKKIEKRRNDKSENR